MKQPGLFASTIKKLPHERPPLWMMRQAGRYHSHYQGMRKKYSFTELCKIPEAACEVTMGPIRDFDFDAAILFSDLLFPLEAMGMGLRYEEGPKLDWHLQNKSDLARLQSGADLARHMDFQGQAIELIKKELPAQKGLIGFVGGPLTLFFYAAAGSHQGDLAPAREGMKDGRFEGFVEKLTDLLAQNMAIQARAGIDTIAVLDTCGGEVDATIYSQKVVPSLDRLLSKFKKLCPETAVTYYSKKTGPDYWKSLTELPIDCMGIDWNHDIAQVLKEWGDRFIIQGNIDPHWLFLEPSDLESKIRKIFESVRALPNRYQQSWVSGLGHGILPKTPESNVKLFIKTQREVFAK